jgi:hypothetical protein
MPLAWAGQIAEAGELTRLTWVYLVVLAVLLCAACGQVIFIGRKLWSQVTTLRVHLVAPVLAFVVGAVYKKLTRSFDPLLRAASITIIAMVLTR